MKKEVKIILVILGIILLILGIIWGIVVGLNKNSRNSEIKSNEEMNIENSISSKENVYSFKAKVLKNNGNSNMLVKVLEDNEFFKRNDEVDVYIENYQFLNIYYLEDMYIEIYFDGSIEETYPLKISTSSIGVIEPPVNIKIKNDTITSNGLTIILKNNSEYDYSYGLDYFLEKLVDGNWIEVKTITGEPLTWNSVAYSLKAGEEKEIVLDFKYSYGELSTGMYKVIKRVFNTVDVPITEDKIEKIQAEFEIK